MGNISVTSESWLPHFKNKGSVVQCQRCSVMVTAIVFGRRNPNLRCLSPDGPRACGFSGRHHQRQSSLHPGVLHSSVIPGAKWPSLSRATLSHKAHQETGKRSKTSGLCVAGRRPRTEVPGNPLRERAVPTLPPRGAFCSRRERGVCPKSFEDFFSSLASGIAHGSRVCLWPALLERVRSL